MKEKETDEKKEGSKECQHNEVEIINTKFEEVDGEYCQLGKCLECGKEIYVPVGDQMSCCPDTERDMATCPECDICPYNQED